MLRSNLRKSKAFCTRTANPANTQEKLGAMPCRAKSCRSIASASALSPEEVWPGAQVQTEPDGGFTLIDYFKPSIEAAVGPSALALRTVARAKQLHRLL